METGHSSEGPHAMNSCGIGSPPEFRWQWRPEPLPCLCADARSCSTPYTRNSDRSAAARQVPMPQVVGGGMGGDFVFIDPDPKDDLRHVRLRADQLRFAPGPV